MKKKLQQLTESLQPASSGIRNGNIHREKQNPRQHLHQVKIASQCQDEWKSAVRLVQKLVNHANYRLEISEGNEGQSSACRFSRYKVGHGVCGELSRSFR